MGISKGLVMNWTEAVMQITGVGSQDAANEILELATRWPEGTRDEIIDDLECARARFLCGDPIAMWAGEMNAMLADADQANTWAKGETAGRAYDREHV